MDISSINGCTQYQVKKDDTTITWDTDTARIQTGETTYSISRFTDQKVTGSAPAEIASEPADNTGAINSIEQEALAVLYRLCSSERDPRTKMIFKELYLHAFEIASAGPDTGK